MEEGCGNSQVGFHPVAVEVVVVTLLALFIIGGNILTLVTFIGSRYLRNAHGLVIISLAFSDLGIGITAMWSIYPAVVHEWPHGPVLCAIQGYLWEVCHANSFFVTIYLSVERYLAVIHPLKYSQFVTRGRVLVLLVFTWVLPFIGFGVPSLNKEFTYRFNDPILICQVSWRQLNSLPLGAVFIWSLFTVLNFGLVTYTCARVSMAMKEVAEKRKGGQSIKSEARKQSRGVKQAINTFKISVVILVAFYMLRAPYVVTILVTGLSVDRCSIPELLLFITYWISMVDGCFNFFVYVVMNKNFRKEFKRLVLRQDCNPPRGTKTHTNERSESKPRSVATVQPESSNNSAKKSEGT